MVDLKNYICTVPFSNLEIHRNDYFLCCPSWLTKRFKRDDYKLDEIWNSEEVVEVRETILDGSYKYCDRTLCPFLSKLLNHGIATAPILKREVANINSPILEIDSPINIVMNFDRTCNYKCPSCRVDLIVENSEGIKTIQNTIDEIDEHYSKYVKTLYITGSGDPFVSVGFRNYLRNFNPEKYPRLKNIHFHTNASMWNKEMWESMPNVHKYVNTCEISIDAGTKETYETKTRLGGSWDKLIDNLYFIKTLPNLRVKTSFVVQDTNYMEMETFYNLMYSIFGRRVNVFFGRITNWGTYSEGEFKIKKVWDPEHPEHDLFKKEFNKIWRNQHMTHNLYEFIQNDRSQKTLI